MLAGCPAATDPAGLAAAELLGLCQMPAGRVDPFETRRRGEPDGRTSQPATLGCSFADAAAPPCRPPCDHTRQP